MTKPNHKAAHKRGAPVTVWMLMAALAYIGGKHA
jgi:hypothetical protein